MANKLSSKIPFKEEMQFEYGVPRELVPGVRRLVANNGGPFTFKGTNTYLIGHKDIAVVDPGPDDPEHLEAILSASEGGEIAHIIVTHTHMDHTEGLDALRDATGAQTYGAHTPDAPRGTPTYSPTESDFVDRAFIPDIILEDGDLIKTDEWTLRAIHTPGHAPDHICLAALDQNILLSGDHVMAWNTSIVAPPEGNMNDYMTSLEKLLEHEHELFLPAHGATIERPRRVVRAYLVHRQMREGAILEAIRTGHNTIPNISEKVYSGIDAAYVNAAKLSVFAHVERLYASGHISCEEPFSQHASFFPREL